MGVSHGRQQDELPRALPGWRRLRRTGDVVAGRIRARARRGAVDKKLRVGVNPTLPPLAKFSDKNELEGFDVDVAKEIARLLGVELELVQVGSPDRIPFVASGRIDIVMGAMTRTPERAKVIDFTVPVHTEILGVLTTEGSRSRPGRS